MDIGNKNVFSLRIVFVKWKNLDDKLNIFMIIYRSLWEQESQVKDLLESVVTSWRGTTLKLKSEAFLSEMFILDKGGKEAYYYLVSGACRFMLGREWCLVCL